MDQKRISIVDAPSNLGLKPPAHNQVPGVIGLPEALRAAGLVSRLNALEAGRVEPVAYSPELDPQIGVRNCAGIQEFSVKLAMLVEKVVTNNGFPLVLGGDCSILIGSMLALRRAGQFGLFFIDGHTDFGYPNTSKTGGAAGMDLALVCGRGPEILTNIDGLRPLVQENQVVVFGYRDVEDPATYSWRDIFETDISLYSLTKIREMGLNQAANQAIAKLKGNNLSGIWIHLDADVLDDEIMPAVDSRQPGGMSYAELSELLRIVLSSGLAIGMEITIFDPTLDRNGHVARAFVDALIDGFMV